MADTYRIISSPVRPPGELRIAHLAALTSVDALCRRARAMGLDPEWVPLILAGDLAGQHATERELAREGLDRATLGREAFVERVREHDAAGRARLAGVLEQLGVEVDVEAGAIDAPGPARAAATAFVRLYEQGRLQHTERVVDHCPRCETVIDPIDAEPGVVAIDCCLVNLRFDDGGVGEPDVLCVGIEAPELLAGVVAIAVPESDPRAGRTVLLPLATRSVPLLTSPAVDRPVPVVPGHSAADLELARAAGLAPIVVLDGEGVVQIDGPLAGMPRYAARAAAEKLLAEEEAIAGVEARDEAVSRCRRCGTVLVSRLGLHWFLAMADLELTAADAFRDGGVTFSPPAVREEVLARAGTAGDWCLSHQVWAGQPVPVARCLDCNQIAVALDGATSCGKCMGMLAPDDSVLDARFVGAVAALAAAGWPDDERAPGDLAPCTTLVVGASGATRWALPIAALGLRLAGAIPFAHVAVHDAPDAEIDPAAVEAVLAEEGRAAVRTWLVAGAPEVAAGREVVDELADPPAGGALFSELQAAWDAAFAAGTPQAGVAALARALADGIPAGDGERVRALAAPVLGE